MKSYNYICNAETKYFLVKVIFKRSGLKLLITKKRLGSKT